MPSNNNGGMSLEDFLGRMFVDMGGNVEEDDAMDNEEWHYTALAESIHKQFEAFVKAGFTEAQAFELTKVMLEDM